MAMVVFAPHSENLWRKPQNQPLANMWLFVKKGDGNATFIRQLVNSSGLGDEKFSTASMHALAGTH
jgi:hypothetical protein